MFFIFLNRMLHVCGTLSVNFGALLRKLTELWRFVCVAHNIVAETVFYE